MNRRVAGWILAGVVVWAPGRALLAQPHGQAIEISAPAGEKTSETATNLDAGRAGELRDEMIKQQLRHTYFRPYNAGQDSSLDGAMFMPAPRQELTPEQAKKLKEMVNKEKYWMFATPEDASADSKSDDVFKDDGLGSDYESDTPKALKSYFEHTSHGRIAGGTNGAAAGKRDEYGVAQRDAIAGDPVKDNFLSPANRQIGNAFDSPANKVIGQLFQSPSARDSIHEGGVVGGNGLFSDLNAPRQDDPGDHRIGNQNPFNINNILNSSASKPAGAYDSLPGNPSAAAGNAFGDLNNLGGGQISSGLSGSSLGGISSSIGASSVPASVQPAPSSGMMPYQPSGPRQRSF